MKKKKKTPMGTTRVPFSIAAMIAAIAWHSRKNASEVLTPMVQALLETEYNTLPEHVRERFPTKRKKNG